MEVGIASALRERHRAIGETQSKALAICLHCAISWLATAKGSPHGNDIRFVRLLIGFNAAYADGLPSEQDERQCVTALITRLLGMDARQCSHALLFQQFSGPIRLLIDNRHVYAPLWTALHDHDSSERWKVPFNASRKAATDTALGSRLAELLTMLLNRPYAPCNQFVHGGAIWKGNISCDQLRDGKTLLARPGNRDRNRRFNSLTSARCKSHALPSATVH